MFAYLLFTLPAICLGMIVYAIDCFMQERHLDFF